MSISIQLQLQRDMHLGPGMSSIFDKVTQFIPYKQSPNSELWDWANRISNVFDWDGLEWGLNTDQMDFHKTLGYSRAELAVYRPNMGSNKNDAGAQ